MVNLTMDPLPSLRAGPMTMHVLHGIFASDQDMYPAPLTFSRLRSWVDACPGLSQCFYLPQTEAIESPEAAEEVAGAIIVLPLNEESWRELLVGKLRETDIDALATFVPDDGMGRTVGLHVFHVERFSDQAKGFAAASLTHARQQAQAKGWNVLGCSALTATLEGAQSFTRMGFVATGYEEVWIERSSQVVLVPIYPGHNRESVVSEHEKSFIKSQARMAVQFLDSNAEDM